MINKNQIYQFYKSIDLPICLVNKKDIHPEKLNHKPFLKVHAHY